MARYIAHRGPDDEDVWVSNGVGFAHRRLSVIDPHAHGRQPMKRGPLTVTYNGEIYNFPELRADLEAAGEVFKTRTDTEVLLAAFERWGIKALDRLNGMFAFALWDERDSTLTIARDRIGKKPLYYTTIDDAFVFGSEIKVLLGWPGFQRSPDYRAIHHYLSLQYVPAPFTAFSGVRKLDPGCYLKLKQGGDIEIERYWRLPPPASSGQTTDELIEQIVPMFEASVKRRMIADVPTGAFLSGGVDSSAVTAFMAKNSSRPVQTFCIGFEEASFDERAYARLVAEKFQTDHHEEVVHPDAVEVLPDLIWHYGEPFADPSAIPTFCVSRLARQHVTVALTGDGGDEFFLGYERYHECAKMDWIDHIPGRGLARYAAAAIPNVLSRRRPFSGLKRRLNIVASSRVERYEPAMMYFFDSDKQEGYGDLLRSFLPENTLQLLEPYFSASPDIVSGAAFADIHTYLPDDLLVKVDVASMAWGLEARAPFLDVELMELAQKIPADAKMQGGILKAALKKSLRGEIPDKVIDRPKMGFGVPIEKWFREDLYEFALDTLTTQRANERGLFRRGYAERLMHEHKKNIRLNHTRLWAMLMLELWFQAWIDEPHPAAPERQYL